MDNDRSSDVRDFYRDLITGGVPDVEATNRVVAKWVGIRSAFDGDSLLGLAHAQLETGRLEERIRLQTLTYIASDCDLDAWDGPAKRKRATALRAFARKLESVDLRQQKAKRIKPPFRSTCLWEEGECLSYRLRSGKYTVLVVVSVQDSKSIGQYSSMGILNWITDSFVDEPVDLRKLPFFPDGSDCIEHFYVYENYRGRIPQERVRSLGAKREISQSMKDAPVGGTFWSRLDAYLADVHPQLK